MKRTWILLAAPVIAAVLAVPMLSHGQDQDNPPPVQQHEGGDGGGQMGGPMNDHGGHRGGPMGGPMDGPMGGGQMHGGMDRPPPPPMNQLERMRNYLDVVERFSKLTRDDTSSSVAAVITAGDVLRQKGPQAQIDYFNEILPKVDNRAVRNAIQLQLVDLYRTTGDGDKAKQLLTQMIVASSTTKPAE